MYSKYIYTSHRIKLSHHSRLCDVIPVPLLDWQPVMPVVGTNPSRSIPDRNKERTVLKHKLGPITTNPGLKFSCRFCYVRTGLAQIFLTVIKKRNVFNQSSCENSDRPGKFSYFSLHPKSPSLASPEMKNKQKEIEIIIISSNMTWGKLAIKFPLQSRADLWLISRKVMLSLCNTMIAEENFENLTDGKFTV